MAQAERRAPTVLLVDDDEDVLSMLSTFLRRNGYHVISSTNPLKALELAGREQVQLLITDLMMPHVDGISLTEKVHQLPQYRDLPVILITAHGTDGLSEAGMRRGVALTLTKPFELAKLLDLVGFATN
jgi:two-component system chemotaxis response regulator CheY